jgi:hypothetical protein
MRVIENCGVNTNVIEYHKGDAQKQSQRNVHFMKTNGPEDADSALRSLLKEWQPQQSLPPRFEERVWTRIEEGQSVRAARLSWQASLAQWIGTMLPRPAPAAGYMAILLAIGLLTGWNQARQETTRITSDLSVRYVKAVDPYLMGP